MTRYALRFMTDQDPQSEPAFRPLRAVPDRLEGRKWARATCTGPSREEATRSEGPRVARKPEDASASVLTKSGVFHRASASLEPTLVDARLSLDVRAVDRALETAASAAYDPTMAAPTMRERLQEMGEIADALVRIHGLSMHDARAPMFGPGTARSRYLRGVQRWCASFARVCDDLTKDLRSGRSADWATLRRQVARAARSHDRGLASAAAADVALLREAQPRMGALVDRLAEQLDQLFGAVDWFEESTRRYIGDAA